jgi:Secretory lipase
VLAWAHGTTGIRPPCAPSLEPDSGIGRIPELQRLIEAGTVIVATDYPGLGTPGTHPYLIGASEGRAVLDALRAAHAIVGNGNAASAIYGHSQVRMRFCTPPSSPPRTHPSCT